MDVFYLMSSTVLLLALIFKKTSPQRPYRVALTASLFALVFSVVFLAVLSMRYDFGNCFYPSRENPYFVSGRLIAGTILPFLFLYIDGLQRILSRLRCASYLLAVVCVIAAAITVSEIIISWPVFSSPYNLFHPQ